MDRSKPKTERRHEARRFAAGLINWRRGKSTHWGLLNDDGKESVAFVTPGDGKPQIGDEIDIEVSGKPRRCYRVARIAPFEKTLVLVGCEDNGAD